VNSEKRNAKMGLKGASTFSRACAILKGRTTRREGKFTGVREKNNKGAAKEESKLTVNRGLEEFAKKKEEKIISKGETSWKETHRKKRKESSRGRGAS